MAKLSVEVADTPLALAQGLMFRKSMPSDEGMLFKFPNTQEACFWGKNTYIPLDVAFVSNDNRITEIKQITPMSTRLVRSKDLCAMAIEANAGYFEKNGIKPGHKIEIQEGSVKFEC